METTTSCCGLKYIYYTKLERSLGMSNAGLLRQNQGNIYTQLIIYRER